MTVILGIDAAWTLTRPSGVSLVAGHAGNWRLVAVASSYAQFYHQAGLVDPDAGFDAHRLLEAALTMAGEAVQLIAADIPLAHAPITKRRESDNAVSRLYGARQAGTHTPSAERPGALADRMRAEFLAAGYPLRTQAPASSGLIEVYPHPALIELTGALKRLPYKIGKTAKYWPDMSAAERRAKLIAQWGDIIAMLDRQLAGTARLLPLPPTDATGVVLKAYEDALDAVVCGWIGTCVVDCNAIALGDSDSAIWIPSAPAGDVGGIVSG